MRLLLSNNWTICYSFGFVGKIFYLYGGFVYLKDIKTCDICIYKNILVILLKQMPFYMSIVHKVKTKFERKAQSLWTCFECVFLLSLIHLRWWKAYSHLLTDYTPTLISPESNSILNVRACLTNECKVLPYSLFVITAVTSTLPFWREACRFPLASVARLHCTFWICPWNIVWEKCKKASFVFPHL